MSLETWLGDLSGVSTNADFHVKGLALPPSGNFTGYPILQCPYCLYSSYALNDFVILNKHNNISEKLALCPKCHNTVRRKTLLETGKMDIQEYAKYLCSLVQYDVDHRVKWHLIKLELAKANYEFRNLFWDSYYQEKTRLDPTWKDRKKLREYSERQNTEIK